MNKTHNKQSQIYLSFQCPKKWKDMELIENDDNRNCLSCQKTVIDFTKKSLNELNQMNFCQNEEQCGHFKSYQLNKPFGNWRDKLISHYQKNQLATSSYPFIKRLKMSTLILLLFITGCAKRFDGNYEAWNYDDSKTKKETKKRAHSKQTQTQE